MIDKIIDWWKSKTRAKKILFFIPIFVVVLVLAFVTYVLYPKALRKQIHFSKGHQKTLDIVEEELGAREEAIDKEIDVEHKTREQLEKNDEILQTETDEIHEKIDNCDSIECINDIIHSQR